MANRIPPITANVPRQPPLPLPKAKPGKPAKRAPPAVPPGSPKKRS